MRKTVSSGSPWEDIVGYSRAVRIGNLIEVSGTTSVDGHDLIGKADVYAQTKFILQKISKALEQCNASLSDVIRTRIYVKSIADWEHIAKAHAEVFMQIRPATSMVEVSRLIDDELLVEIEATAFVE